MTSVAPPIRVLLADDHRMFRQGLRDLLDRQPDLQVVGEAGNGREALALAAELAPDVVLMDLQMPEMDGAAATRALVERQPNAKVVVLTMYREVAHLLAAIQAGAKAYVLKDADAAELVDVIRRVQAGDSVLDPAVTAGLFEAVRRLEEPQLVPEPLTPRELDILRLLVAGHDNRTIAAELHLSEKTVANRLSEVFQKLGVTNRTQAALMAVQRGLVKAEPDERPGRAPGAVT